MGGVHASLPEGYSRVNCPDGPCLRRRFLRGTPEQGPAAEGCHRWRGGSCDQNSGGGPCSRGAVFGVLPPGAGRDAAAPPKQLPARWPCVPHRSLVLPLRYHDLLWPRECGRNTGRRFAGSGRRTGPSLGIVWGALTPSAPCWGPTPPTAMICSGPGSAMGAAGVVLGSLVCSPC